MKRLPPIDTNLLQTFIAVSESLSFTRAAGQLNISQSAVSQQIKRLEDLTGHELMKRTKRSLVLTNAGRQFLPYARRLVNLHEQALKSVEMDELQGTLRFAAPEVYARRYLPAILPKFRQLYPGVQLELTCEQSLYIAQKMEDGEVDIRLNIRDSSYPPGITLGSEQLVWVAAKDMPLPPKGKPIPLAFFNRNCIYREQAKQALVDAGMKWEVVCTTQSATGIELAVEGRHAISVRSIHTVPEHWRILGKKEGFPELSTVDLEIRTSPTIYFEAARMFHEMLEDLVKQDLAA